MLEILVSDTLQADPTKPVFVDRNGDTFGFVLDYLCYGSIPLPISVSKNMFLHNLDFYGIVPSEGTVKTSSEAWAVQVKDCLGKMYNLEEERKNLGIINDIDFLANHCAGQYLLGI